MYFINIMSDYGNILTLEQIYTFLKYFFLFEVIYEIFIHNQFHISHLN